MANNNIDNNYFITDGKKYIRLNCRGQYEVVNDFSLADNFSKGKAIAILNRSLKKSLKRTFYVGKMVNGEIKSTLGHEKGEICPENKVVAKWENDYAEKDKENIERWLKRVDGFCNLVTDAKNRMEEIEPAIARLDSIYRELDHYTEGRRVNASKGYCLENLRHKIRNKRRALKIELQIVQIISKHINEEDNKKFSKAMEMVENKVYAPKILTDLFENDDLSSVSRIIEEVGA